LGNVAYYFLEKPMWIVCGQYVENMWIICYALERPAVIKACSSREVTSSGVAHNRRYARLGWIKLLAARRRKTMVVCLKCHQDITAGRPIQRAPSGRGFMHNPKEWHRSKQRT